MPKIKTPIIINNNFDLDFGASILIGLVAVAGVNGLACPARAIGIPDGDCFRASKSDFRDRTEISGMLGFGDGALSLKLRTGEGGIGIGLVGMVGIKGIGGVGGVIGLGVRGGSGGGVGRENPPD